MINALRLVAVLAFAATCSVAQAAEGRAVMSIGAVVLGAPCVASTAATQTGSSGQCRAMVHVEDNVTAVVSQATVVATAQVVEYVY